jgi:hypothetical protein
VSEKILWEQTPEKRVWFIRNGEHLVIETEWTVDSLLDDNKAKQADYSSTGKLGEMVQVASIPTGMYWDWQRQGILDDDAAFRRRINSSDYQHLRTNNLKV